MIKKWHLNFRESQRDRELGLASLSYLCNISTRSITIVHFQSNHWKSVIIIVFNKNRDKNMIVMIDLRKSQLTGQGHHQVGWSSSLSSSSDAYVARGNPQVGWATTGDSLCLLIIKRMIVFFTAEYAEIKLQDNATYPQPLDQKNAQNSLQNWVDPRLPQRYTTIDASW